MGVKKLSDADQAQAVRTSKGWQTPRYSPKLIEPLKTSHIRPR